MTVGTATPEAETDRTDFTHILVRGTRVGAAIGAAVIVYLLVSRYVPGGIARALLQAVIVLTAAVAASLLPARWAMARGPQGMAGAAAIGLWGTIVFMAIDVIVLRPVKAYPWTWDAVGGGSTWWYLPVWWMLGTFVAWMGGLLTAGRAARGGLTTLAALATPVLGGTVAIAAAAQLAHLGVYLPVATGAAYTLTLTVLAVVAIARKA
jgi:hypothetical protein